MWVLRDNTVLPFTYLNYSYANYANYSFVCLSPTRTCRAMAWMAPQRNWAIVLAALSVRSAARPPGIRVSQMFPPWKKTVKCWLRGLTRDAYKRIMLVYCDKIVLYCYYFVTCTLTHALLKGVISNDLQWPWVTRIARPLCDSWVSCYLLLE